MRLSWPARMTCSLPRLSRCRTSPATSQVTVCRPVWGWGPMSRPRVSVTSSWSIWSAKHQAPTVRRPMRGRARRTRMAPTTDSRLGVISTQAGRTALACASDGGASTVLTGPLTKPLCVAPGALSSPIHRPGAGRNDAVMLEGDTRRGRRHAEATVTSPARTRPAATRLAWALCVLSVTLALAAVALAFVNGENLVELVAAHHAIGILDALVLSLVGALIVVRDRRHLLAWLLLVDSVLLAVFNFAAQYAPLALGLTSRHLSLPGGNLASWLASWTNVPGIVIAVVFLVLLFPDGRMPLRRWWPLGLAGAVALVVPTIVLAVGTWPLRGPGLVTREDELPDLVDTVFWTTFLVSLVLGPSAWSRWCCGSAAPGRCSASRSSGSPTAPPRASPSACSPRRDPTGPTSSSWGRPCSWPGWASASSGSGCGTSTGWSTGPWST